MLKTQARRDAGGGRLQSRAGRQAASPEGSMKQNRRQKSAPPADDAEKPLAGSLPGLVPEQLGDDVELNLKIVSLLQEDGRMPFSTIAERTGVSEGTVRNRVNQLRAAHVMAVTASVSPEAFGYRWNSTTLMKVNPAASIEKLAMRLARVPEVYYVVQLTGPYSLGIAAYHRDREHFREFLAKHVYGHSDILEVESNVNLKVYKITMHFNTPA
jgi:Lrp/AsnC family transcriptional regulator for asnA, asnC and gidA